MAVSRRKGRTIEKETERLFFWSSQFKKISKNFFKIPPFFKESDIGT